MVIKCLYLSAVESVEATCEAPGVSERGALSERAEEKGLQKEEELPKRVGGGFTGSFVGKKIGGRKRGLGNGCQKEMRGFVGKSTVGIS